MSTRWGQPREDVQCYELFGGIALKNHAFSFFHFSFNDGNMYGHVLTIKNIHMYNIIKIFYFEECIYTCISVILCHR